MQSLILSPQQSGPVVVLKATGELDLHTQDEFEQILGELLQSSPVVVDLSGLEFFAISALRSLIVGHRAAASAGHDVCYAQPSSQLLRLLTISGLLGVLPVRLEAAETSASAISPALAAPAAAPAALAAPAAAPPAAAAPAAAVG